MEENNNKNFLLSGLTECKEKNADTVKNSPLFFYRLLESSLLEVLVDEHGIVKASEYLYKAGYKAGLTLATKFLDFNQNFDGFFLQLSKLLRNNNLGILAVEEVNLENSTFIFTISEDLECRDCCKQANRIVCRYDEGLIAGIMEAYMGENITVNEVDCWAFANGCSRFRGAPTNGKKEKHTT